MVQKTSLGSPMALTTTLLAKHYWLKRHAKNLNHLTLAEIKDFTALGNARCFSYFVKRCRNRAPRLAFAERDPA